jgi:hypothetical protein
MWQRYTHIHFECSKYFPGSLGIVFLLEKIYYLSLCTKYYYGDQIKKDEMDGECSAHGGKGEIRTFWLQSLKGRNHSKDLGADGKIILK